MSRSRKKVPGYADRNPFMKNYANKVIRGIKIKVNNDFENVNEELPQYSKYRRITDSWNICDYTWLYHSEKELNESIERQCEYFYESWYRKRKCQYRNIDHFKQVLKHQYYSK